MEGKKQDSYVFPLPDLEGHQRAAQELNFQGAVGSWSGVGPMEARARSRQRESEACPASGFGD